MAIQLDLSTSQYTIEGTAGDDFLSKCYTWVMTQEDMTGSSAV